MANLHCSYYWIEYKNQMGLIASEAMFCTATGFEIAIYIYAWLLLHAGLMIATQKVSSI